MFGLPARAYPFRLTDAETSHPDALAKLAPQAPARHGPDAAERQAHQGHHHCNSSGRNDDGDWEGEFCPNITGASRKARGVGSCNRNTPVNMCSSDNEDDLISESQLIKKQQEAEPVPIHVSIASMYIKKNFGFETCAQF
ncbi:hypothetical protein PVAP13_3KG146200 [Panicum virgatum]|uniref:Uncharacterized protein n=1 Tax=Panicum virgatum TaxID=38727 RepID=A0A8T0UWZ3_PANVG|nr:hypothetical protein PVAP13_3KG146200 [Panicum virgatum]